MEQLAILQADRHRVTVYTSALGARGLPRVDQRLGRYGLLRVVRHRGALIFNVPLMPALPVHLLRHAPRPDVLHVHTGQVLLAEVTALVARLRGIPYVVHQHLLLRPSTRLGRMLLPAYLRFPYAWVLRHADRVICLTGTMRDAVVATFGVDPARTSVVHNGVDHSTFRPGREPRRPDEVAFVGRLAVQKNVTALLEAVARLRDEGRDVRVRLIGEGDQRARLQAIAAAHGLSNVAFEGRLPRAEVAAALARATAVVLPSTHEGLPLVLLEAMACGTPVIASSIPEVVETGGGAIVTADPAVPGELAGMLARLLDDAKLRDRLSAAALARARDFAWPAVAALLDSLYAEVCGAKARRRDR